MLDEKKKLVQKLRDAKKAHRRWVSNAQILIEGVPVKNDQLPLNETECGFGHWYYGAGQAFNMYSEFRAIEEPHTALHTIYLKIFNLLFRERKVSLFGKLLGKKAEPSPEELAEARSLFPKLNEESEKIMEMLTELEDRIMDMDEETFKKVYL